MKTKITFFYSVLAVQFLLVVSIQSYATLNYNVNFTASGVTSSVGSVLVQNLTKGINVTVPTGNSLKLTDVPSAVEAINVEDTSIRILQNASNGSSILTFYADQPGNTQVVVYALDDRKVVELSTRLEIGDNSYELLLPTGMYVIWVSGNGYTYSAKMQSRSGITSPQAEIKFLNNKKVSFTNPQKSNSSGQASTTMIYNTGDQLLYTATSGSYISTVFDIPTDSKTINFKFFILATSAIPAGNFSMGSPVDEIKSDPIKDTKNETQFQVTLSAFRMSKYEITNAQYGIFLNEKNIGSNGLYANGTYPTQKLIIASSFPFDWGLHYSGSQWIPVAGYENNPVINVTWYGATEYASYIGGALPTEAQWEYACRAGTTTPFNTGSCLTNTHANYGWSHPYNTCSNTVTKDPQLLNQVGTYLHNSFGLYDMHGNAWEWCSDFYGFYPNTPQTNPTGPATGQSRIYRGGGWPYGASDCRSAYRYNANPTLSNINVGFRVVFAQ